MYILAEDIVQFGSGYMKDDLGVQTDRQAGSNASYAGRQGQGLMVLAGFDAQGRTGGGGLV